MVVTYCKCVGTRSLSQYRINIPYVDILMVEMYCIPNDIASFSGLPTVQYLCKHGGTNQGYTVCLVQRQGHILSMKKY